MAFPKKVPLGNATGMKTYAGSKDKNAGAISTPKAVTPAMTAAAKPKAARAAVLPKHPGEVDLPAMHTSKHN